MQSAWTKLRLNIFFFRLVLDPNRTDLIFEAIRIASKQPDPAIVELVEREVRKHPAFFEMYDRRYLAEPPTMEALSQYPEGSFGKALYRHLHDNGITLDLFPQIEIDGWLDYMTARMYQDHDLWHVILGYGVGLEDELAIQGFGLAQYKSPLGALIVAAGLLNLLRKNPAQSSEGLEKVVEGHQRGARAKFLLGIKLHDLFDRPLSEVRRICGVDRPGDLHFIMGHELTS